MPFLNILIWILGGVGIAIYLFFQIRKFIKWKKLFKELMKQKNMTPKEAQKIANETIYKKKAKKSKKEKEVDDIIYED